jgi:hypothetical protein
MFQSDGTTQPFGHDSLKRYLPRKCTGQLGLVPWPPRSPNLFLGLCHGLQILKIQIGKVYSLEFTEIPKVFLHITGEYASSATKGITNKTMVSKATVVSKETVATISSSNDLGSHCCNNVLQQ